MGLELTTYGKTAGLWLTIRAACLDHAGPAARSAIAVTIETASPAERCEVFARVFGLGGRESELLGHLVAGHRATKITAMMFLSEYTIQDHLKAVAAKTGIRTRGALISFATGS